MPDLHDAFRLLEVYVQQHIQHYRTPGLALALTDRERTLHLSTYGFADLATQTPVTPETFFQIGSISKSFTALALMQQYEAGSVDLHAPVTDYLPWFVVRSTYEPITLHHLLCHTSGIVTGSTFTPASPYEVAALRHTEVGFSPGKRFHYSNIGYVTLGYVLEAVLGRNYGDIIRSHILQPLEMHATDATITNATRQRLAVGHVSFYDDRPLHSSHPLAPAPWGEWTDADGSIAATPGDLARYVRMLLNHGRGPTSELLTAAGFDLMTQPFVHVWQNIHAGYGIFRDVIGGWSSLSLTGGMIGFQAMILADPEVGIGALVLENGPGAPWAVAEYALTLLRASSLESPLPPVPSVTQLHWVEHAADYAGIYSCDNRTLVIECQNNELLVQLNGEQVRLEPRGADTFSAHHPHLAHYPLRFGWTDGQVVELFYGPHWYVNDRYQGSTNFTHPAQWAAFPGHYRSHNPWMSNVRVVLRKGSLLLIEPSGGEEPLVEVADGVFRVGSAPDTPERLYFDTVVNGHTLRAVRSGCELYRVSTP